MPAAETPKRRHDDAVSYRDMVDYVVEHDAMMHAARAESLIFIGNALEKMEKAIRDHEEWHRDYLQDLINQSRASRLTIVSIVIASVVALIGTVVSIVLTLVHTHGA